MNNNYNSYSEKAKIDLLKRLKEGKVLNIDPEILGNQKTILVGTAKSEKSKVESQDKNSFEDYKTVYKGLIDEKCLADYGTLEDKKLWEDTAEEMFLSQRDYIPMEKENADGDLQPKTESRKLVKESKSLKLSEAEKKCKELKALLDKELPEYNWLVNISALQVIISDLRSKSDFRYTKKNGWGKNQETVEKCLKQVFGNEAKLDFYDSDIWAKHKAIVTGIKIVDEGKIEEQAEKKEEAGLSRLLNHIKGETSFAVIGSQDKDTKEDRFEELMSEVHRVGGKYEKIGFNQLQGTYTYEDGKTGIEKSLIIYNISKEEAINIMKKLNQESIIYKDKDFFGFIDCNGNEDNVFQKRSFTFDKAIADLFGSKLKKGNKLKPALAFECKLIETDCNGSTFSKQNRNSIKEYPVCNIDLRESSKNLKENLETMSDDELELKHKSIIERWDNEELTNEELEEYMSELVEVIKKLNNEVKEQTGESALRTVAILGGIDLRNDHTDNKDKEEEKYPYTEEQIATINKFIKCSDYRDEVEDRVSMYGLPQEQLEESISKDTYSEAEIKKAIKKNLEQNNGVFTDDSKYDVVEELTGIKNIEEMPADLLDKVSKLSKVTESYDEEDEEEYIEDEFERAENYDGNMANDDLEEDEWKLVHDNAPEIFKQALRARADFVVRNFDWKEIPDVLWDYIDSSVDEQVGWVEYTPEFIIDNIIVNGDWGDFDDYKEEDETDEEFIERVQDSVVDIFPEERIVVFSL